MATIGTPIPSRDREYASRGTSEAIRYKLTPEELAKITGKPIPEGEKPVTFTTDQWTKGVDGNVVAQNRRGPAPKDGPACGLTKQKFLEAIAAGETTSSIEKAWGMKYNTLYDWVKKWDLKGVGMEKAAEMIAGQDVTANGPAPVAPAASTPGAPAAQDEQTDIIERLQTELKEARAAAADSAAQASVSAAKFQADIDELRNDRDEWQRTANGHREAHDELTRLYDAANERIRHLEADLDLIREPIIIEVSAPQPAGFISLRFPIIDTGERDISSRLKSLEMIGGISEKPLDITSINLPLLARDGLEVMQIIIGVVQAMTADIVEPADLERTLQQFFGRHNEEHIKRLRILAEKHVWEVGV